MQAAIADAWRRLVPTVSWRGVSTGWTAMDIWTLGEVVHAVQPRVVLVAGGNGRGGMPYFVADCMDQCAAGRVVVADVKPIGSRFPRHRRIQWLTDMDLLGEDFQAAERLTSHSSPVLVVESSIGSSVSALAGLVTPGSYLVARGGEVWQDWPEGFTPDPACDEMGLSACTWLRRET